MIPEMGRSKVEGVAYLNERLGIHGNFSLFDHFYEDGKEKRVWDKNGRYGWSFGYSYCPVPEDHPIRHELVKWDDGEISGIHQSQLA